MPFIEVKTTEDLSAVAAELKSALGDAITAIPGKSESWLMVNLVGEQKNVLSGQWRALRPVLCVHFRYGNG